MDFLEEEREHHLMILGLICMLATLIIISMGVWFFLEWFKLDRKRFDPTSDEQKINIQYGYMDSVYVFIPMLIISFLTYIIGGSILLSSEIKTDHKTLVLCVSIIPAVISIIFFLNAGISFQNSNDVKKNYTDSTKQSSANQLKDKGVPYVETGVTSLIIAIVEVIVMASLLGYFYMRVPEPRKSPTLPPEPIPKEKKNFLMNDKFKTGL